jgi:hypothetical protein
MRLHHGVFVLGLLLATTGEGRGQSALTGTVLTMDSVAIVAAAVTLHDATGKLKAEAVTDSMGSFHFRVANVADSLTLFMSITSVGFASIEFAPVQLRAGEDIAVRVHMTPDAVPLAPVAVVARQQNLSAALHDFYDKLADTKRGVGHGLDRAVMRRFGGLELIKALQLVPGVDNGRSMLPEGVTLTVPRMRNGCIPLTFLDRVPIAAEQLAVMDPADLEGVLVYVGGLQVPPDFSQLMAGVDCGMILAYRIAPAKRRSTLSLVGVLLILSGFAAFAASAGW